MSSIGITGIGAVSPAGWGVEALSQALQAGQPLPVQTLSPLEGLTLRARRTPPPRGRPDFMGHARLRRTSPISHFAVGAALEALGAEAGSVQAGKLSLAIVFCVMCGCVNYSRRFYDETLKDPATASPLLFPETVYNAPASHLAALLGSTSRVYTIVGDSGVFLEGLALGARWLRDHRTQRCLVVAAEELDWLTVTAQDLFDPSVVLADGAGAICMARTSDAPARLELDCVSDPHLFTTQCPRAGAAEKARRQMGPGSAEELLCDGLVGSDKTDLAETTAWKDWPGPRISPKRVLGESFPAAAAWQCVAALDVLSTGKHTAATVSVVGCNEQAVAARFRSAGRKPHS